MLGLGFPLSLAGGYAAPAAAPSGPTFTWASGTSSANWGLSPDNLTGTLSGLASGDALLRGSVGRSATGSAYYFEVSADVMAGFGENVGITTAAAPTTEYVSNRGLAYIRQSSTARIDLANVTLVSGLTVAASGDIFGILIDSGKAYVRLNGAWLGGCDGDARTGGFDISALGTVYPAVSGNSSGSSSGQQVTIHTPASVPAGTTIW